MKTSIMALTTAALMAGTALSLADDVKIGALMDATGPIASFMPPLQNATNLAIKHVNDGGGLLGGKAVLAIGDTGGAAQAAVDAAGKLVNVENVPVIMGAFMSGTTIAAANAATIPAGVVQISPTATSPGHDRHRRQRHAVPPRAVRQLPGRGARQDRARRRHQESRRHLCEQRLRRRHRRDLHQGLQGCGRRSDRRREARREEELLPLRTREPSPAPARPTHLVVIAYAGDSGSTIVKQAIEGGLFDRFIGTDGLRDDALIKEVGADALKTSFFSSPTSPADNPAQAKLHELYNAEFKEGADKAFVDQTYDATFLAALAVAKAGSTDRTKIAKALRDVASAPGEVILPGEWAKALEALKAGKDIDYEGAGGSYDFDAHGDVTGYHRQVRRRRRQVQAGRHIPVTSWRDASHPLSPVGRGSG